MANPGDKLCSSCGRSCPLGAARCVCGNQFATSVPQSVQPTVPPVIAAAPARTAKPIEPIHIAAGVLAITIVCSGFFVLVWNSMQSSPLPRPSPSNAAETPPITQAQPDNSPPVHQSGHLPSIGDVVTLRSDAAGAATEDDFHEFIHAVAAHDKEGYAAMAADGRLTIIDAGTQVRIIGYGGFLSGGVQVRILGGNDYGHAAWVTTESVE